MNPSDQPPPPLGTAQVRPPPESKLEVNQVAARLSRVFFWLFLLVCFGAVGVFAIFAYYSKELPSTEELKNYYPKTTTRLYDANGGLLASFSSENRIFVPVTSIPDVVKEAFISDRKSVV